MAKKQKKLTVEEFVFQAIRNLRTEKSKGIHVVFSGFNKAFREYFPGKEPKDELAKLVEAGKIELQARRGGPMMYLAGEAPKGDQKAEDALRRILEE